MTLEICGGALDGKKVSGPRNEVKWIVDGEPYLVCEFKYDKVMRKILIPVNTAPANAVALWLARHV